jgi:hypothetical protein
VKNVPPAAPARADLIAARAAAAVVEAAPAVTAVAVEEEAAVVARAIATVTDLLRRFRSSDFKLRAAYGPLFVFIERRFRPYVFL